MKNFLKNHKIQILVISILILITAFVFPNNTKTLGMRPAEEQTEKYGKVITQTLNVRKGPATTFDVIEKIHLRGKCAYICKNRRLVCNTNIK